MIEPTPNRCPRTRPDGAGRFAVVGGIRPTIHVPILGRIVLALG